MMRRKAATVWTLVFLLTGGVAQPAALSEPSAADAATPPARDPGSGGTPSSTVLSSGMIPADRLRWHIPDPEYDRPVAEESLERARSGGDRAQELHITRVAERVNEIRRPKQLKLTLDDAVRMALENNYDVQVASYNPAVDTTRIVEAQAAFDAVFFTNIVKNHVDRPSGSQLAATSLDAFQSSYGVRKVLPSGMTVSGQYQLNRTKTSLSFQSINPEYTSNLVLEMRQPMLRRFGIDYNRSLILVARNDRRISQHAFERQVRDTLRQVDELYWRLVQARRDVTITARLLADFHAIYEYLEARQQFDITPVQLAATRANLEQAKADFISRRANVFNAEDRLVAAMNAQNVNLADETEIIPEDLPQTPRLLVDRLAEVQTALDNREEIKEQELRVANAELLVGRAKNEELPRFDLTFRTTHDGLAQNADGSFDEMSRSKFIEYFVGVEFEMPIGNRGPRAAHFRARLQHQQQAAQLKSTFEKIILDVNLTVRKLDTAYDQILPSFEAAQAREREVDSIVARAERKDINTLTTELNARQSLAGARRAMLGAMVEYNISIVDLERAKGSLLQYHNVVIPEED
ncbi:MAG: TolC family protein [Planctomycetota bacterium]